MTMRRVLGVLLVMGVCVTGWGQSRNPRDRAVLFNESVKSAALDFYQVLKDDGLSHKQIPLVGLKEVWCLVEERENSGTEPDGLRRAQIKTDIELKLRTAGIPVLTKAQWALAPGHPYLYIYLREQKQSDAMDVCFVKVELLEKVYLERNSLISVYKAATWTTDSGMVVEHDNVQDIRDAVNDQVDEFINDYLVANPAAKTNLEVIQVKLPSLPKGAKPLAMVKIPAGTFTMGSPSDERGRASKEEQHVVTITEAFYLGKYEVTQTQWESVMGSNPARSSSYGVGDDNPVHYVSWDDCQTFIENLNGTGQGTFRLPTEAEWEYACRAGTDTRFSFGDALGCDDSCGFCDLQNQYMVWCGNANDGSEAVGSKLPNPWGLYGMHGNLFEWCSDWYGSYPSGPQVDPQGGLSKGSDRVLRDGYWRSHALFCRSAHRGSASPDDRHYGIGLRLVRKYP